MKNTKRREMGNAAREIKPSDAGVRRIERIGLVCVTLGLSGLLVVNHPSIWSTLFESSSPEKKIGKLHLDLGSVRQKSYRNPLWRDLAEGDTAITRGDSLFTGGDGKAELRFENGTVTTLWPNSLVVIDVIPPARRNLKLSVNELSLKIEKGNVSVKTGETPLQIRNNDKNFIVKENQKTPIDVVVDTDKGESSIRFAGSQAQDAIKELTSQGAKSVPADVISPDDQNRRELILKKIVEARKKNQERYLTYFKRKGGVKDKFLVGMIAAIILALVLIEVHTSRKSKH